MDLYGKLHKVVSNGEIRRKDGSLVVGRGGKPMKKMEFVLQKKTSGDTPRYVSVEAINEDVIRFVEDTSIGTVLKVGVDVDSREYQDRWYTSVKAHTVEIYTEVGATATRPQPVALTSEEDDLPF